MTYTQKYYEEIFEEMLNDSVEKGLISHAEDFKQFISNKEDISNYYVMDKSVIALMVSKIYQDMTEVYTSPKINYANGSDLDDIGDIVGVPRPAATCAEVLVTFSLEDELDELITIPEGVIISTNDEIRYVTLEELIFDESKLESVAQCRSIQAGPEYKVLENTLNQIVSPLNMDYNISCTNKTASSGGEETYSDEKYRDLLKNWKQINLKGSLESYENYFANFDGIDGFKLVPNWDGTGTIKIILDPGTDEQLYRAFSELNSSITQCSESITLFSPTDKYIDIQAIFNCDIDVINPYSLNEKEDIRRRIIQAIKTFIDGGYCANGDYYSGLKIGEDFIPHKLSVFLDSEISEIKNIKFNFPEDFIAIGTEEKGKSRNIDVEMI